MSEAHQRVGQLIRGLAALGVGNYGAMAASLAINAMLTRRLGAEQFGHLALLLMASQVVLMLSVNWTQTGIIRFGAQEYAATGSISEAFWTRTWVVAPWVVLAAIVMVVAARPLSAYLAIPPWGLLIVMTHFTASFVVLSVGAAFQARNEMSRYGTALFLDKAIMAVLLVLLPAASVRGPVGVLGMYAASLVAVAVWGLFLLGRRSLLPVVFKRDTYRHMLAFSFPLIVSSWVGLLGTNWIDLIVIRSYRPVTEIGLYSLGIVLAGVVQQVTIIFSTLVLPQLAVMVAKGEIDKIRTLVERVLPYWFLGTSILFSAVLIGASWIVPLVFGSAFERSGAVLALLMPAAAALALFSAFSPLVSAMGSTWVLTGIYLVSGAVNVGLDLLLVPRFGIQGAALATVASYSASAVMVLVFASAKLHGRLFGLALFAMPVAAICLCFALLSGPLFYAVAITAGATIVFWLIRRFRLFRGEDAVFFDNLRLLAPLLSGMPLAVTRRR